MTIDKESISIKIKQCIQDINNIYKGSMVINKTYLIRVIDF